MNLPSTKGGIVIGLGCDIIEIERIKNACDRHAERFLNRVFTSEELDYCMQMKNPHPHLAARFAAKEAVSKAFTTGIGADLNWTSISVGKGEREQPLVNLDAKGQRLLDTFGGTDVLITLSHTRNYAQAVAIILKNTTIG